MKEKIIYECFYKVGANHFNSIFELVVDRETEKMLYGEVFLAKDRQDKWGRFSLNKHELSEVKEIIRSNKSCLRVRVEADSKEEAEGKAFKCIYDYLIEMAQRVNDLI